jgi:flavorubredoxin
MTDTISATARPLAFPPQVPTLRVPPTKIADETWVIHQVQDACGEPLQVYLNSMVIRGAEPVIVDTGTPANRRQWLEDVFTLVEPEDVRWIFLSHDDIDHTGNLDETVALCRNATVVCNWAMIERNANCFDFPLARCRWVLHGESFDAGDRTFRAIRPPVFDSPTTRGLYDPVTRVLWAADTFATPLPDAALGVADLDEEFWRFGMTLFALGAVSPWIVMTDPAKYRRHVELTRSLDLTTVACCHSPVLEGPYIEKAFDIVCSLPLVDFPDLPGQSVLDLVVAATAQPPA